MSIKLDNEMGDFKYFDVYYIMDLNTREILRRIDPEETIEVEEAASEFIKDHPEIEIVRALSWKQV